ncbi:MAG TPA: hypothetical protein VH740_18695 [Vicinamibacterales bacterium]|jgi:photosystem II stability/assembly factor-like uncharacterized protein
MRTLLVLLAAAAAWVLPAAARQNASAADLLNATSFRNIGPFRTSAWVTEIAVPDTPARDHLYTIYAATRTGGLWKTTNNGITWAPISDSVDVAAVGAVAVASSNSSIVWMGTGDQANARSSYSGKGVFKSIDAGKSWQLMGLPDSHHIARIVIHPTNPEIVYVAAMGHLFSRNEERGVFRTRNGGKTWDKVLYVDDGTGAIDLAINKKSPDTLYAAMYEKHRTPWQLTLGGPGSGVYRTDDGGVKWRKLEGLPSGNVGRIGLDVNPRNPNLLTIIVENLNARKDGMPGRVDACQVGAAARGGGGRGGRGSTGGPMGNEVYRSEDGGKTWKKTHGDDVDVAGSKAPYSFNQIKTNPADPNQIIVNSDSMYESRDGGKTWSCDFFRGVFGDFRSLWWDEQDPQRIMLGSDGGVNVSYDGGRTGDYFLNMRVGEVYAIGVDMDDPYNVYGGLQDHDSWKGPSNSKGGRITLEDWTTVGTGDGMYNQVDPTSSRWAYNSFQTGGQRRFDQWTGQAANIQPQRAQGAPALRYNWITPLVLSPHNPQIVYTGAQVLFRSLNRGDAWQEISPDLTTNDTSKCGLNSGYVPYCTITSISESPAAAGVIWIGTDDGKVQVTRDHGASWVDVTPAIASAGGPVDRYVSRVFASPHQSGTAFVAKNGFRNDDFQPFLYRTTDFGKSWTSIAGNLVRSPINVIVQDRKNTNLLIVGNDLGVWASIDAGATWERLKANLPVVPVHDLTVHPRENDLVLGTYGRGIFVGDITHLQELSADVLAKPMHLFAVEPRAAYAFRAQGNYHLFGSKYIEVPNEPDALTINYYLRAKADAGARVTVTDIKGDQVATLKGPAEAGLNRVLWNMRAGSGETGGRGGFGGRGAGPTLPIGDYKITVDVAGQQQSTIGRIRDRIWPQR